MKRMFLFLSLFVLLFLVSCNQNQTSSVPIYERMELSRYNLMIVNESDYIHGDQLAYEKMSDVSSTTKEESQEVNSFDEVAYFSEKNKDLYLIVHITNPDEYVIQSFTLNGEKYSSDQLENGSDFEHLVLKLNSGTIEGIREFIIENIKYVDNIEVQDVVIGGNQSIKLGVTYTYPPNAILYNLDTLQTHIILDIFVVDSSLLTEEENGYFNLVLYQGETIVDTTPFTIGYNHIIFDDLLANTDYRFEIVASYDCLDGNGLVEDIQLSASVKTDNFIHITNVTATHETIYFEVETLGTGTEGSITSIELFCDGILMKTLTNLNKREFTDLRSDKSYSIKLTYTYNLMGYEDPIVDVVTYDVATQQVNIFYTFLT